MNARSDAGPPTKSRLGRALSLGTLILVNVSLLLLGCRSMQPTPLTEKELTPFVSISLREGDVITISFPGSPNLNTSPQIRRDGKIDLPLGGELLAAGKTPAELEKELLEHFGPQLVVKEVSVAIKSSSYPVFVTGAVVRPGKLLADRPLHALEAIMEAGGFDLGRANLKAVAVIRIEEGQVKHYVLNLKLLLEGRTKDLFYLHPSDIIYVPEKAF